MSERAIERKHHVGRRTIVKAIASAEPPPRKNCYRTLTCPVAGRESITTVTLMTQQSAGAHWTKAATFTLWQLPEPLGRRSPYGRNDSYDDLNLCLQANGCRASWTTRGTASWAVTSRTSPRSSWPSGRVCLPT